MASKKKSNSFLKPPEAPEQDLDQTRFDPRSVKDGYSDSSILPKSQEKALKPVQPRKIDPKPIESRAEILVKQESELSEMMEKHNDLCLQLSKILPMLGAVSELSEQFDSSIRKSQLGRELRLDRRLSTPQFTRTVITAKYHLNKLVNQSKRAAQVYGEAALDMIKNPDMFPGE